MLLSYYVASINIEHVYHQVRAEQGMHEGYVEFPSMTLTDTFQLRDGDDKIDGTSDGLQALHNSGCSWGLNPPVSRSARVM